MGERAVDAAHGVPGVLPALVGQPVPGGVDVLQQMVAVGVAVLDQPGQRPRQRRQQGLDLLGGQAPAAGVGQGEHPQRGGVDGAVVDRRQGPVDPVGGVRLPERERRAAHLVEDLAGLLRGVRVGPRALPVRQDPQRRGGEVGGDRQHHPRRPQAVPAEQGEEPGRARADELLVGGVGGGQAQQAQVVQRPRHHRGQTTVGADDVQRAPGGRAAGAGHHRPGVGEAEQQLARDALPGFDVDAPGHDDGAVLDRPVRPVGPQRAPEPVQQPDRLGAAHVGRGDQRVPAAALDRVQRGQVGPHPDLQHAAERRRSGGHDGDLLADQARLDLTPALDPHGRVCAAVPECPGHGQEHVGVAAVVVVGQRRGLLAVDGDHALTDEPAVGVEEPLDTGVTHLAVLRGPGLGGGGQHEGEVVDPRLTTQGHVCDHVRHLLPPTAP